MINKNRWINNYNDLEPTDQLEIAELILNELQDNESALEDDEYDKERSKKIRELLNKVLTHTNQDQELSLIIERYEQLSVDRKEKITMDLFNLIKQCYASQESDRIKNICKQEGHLFGDWKKSYYYKLVTVGDSGIESLFTGVDTKEVRCCAWHKKCQRCGYIKTVKSEPQELKEARQKKNKEAHIRRLERKIEELKAK